MNPRHVPDNAMFQQCPRCGYMVTELNEDKLCPTCEEYCYRMKLRDRRGYVPAIPQPTHWPEALVEALQKINFWRDK